MVRGFVDDFGQHWVARDDHKQALAEKDREIKHLKEKVAHYDRWLSKGVYYTNEEFSERVLKPKQQLMAQAVRFAEAIYDPHVIVDDPLYEEAKVFLKEREQ